MVEVLKQWPQPGTTPCDICQKDRRGQLSNLVRLGIQPQIKHPKYVPGTSALFSCSFVGSFLYLKYNKVYWGKLLFYVDLCHLYKGEEAAKQAVTFGSKIAKKDTQAGCRPTICPPDRVWEIVFFLAFTWIPCHLLRLPWELLTHYGLLFCFALWLKNLFHQLRAKRLYYTNYFEDHLYRTVPRLGRNICFDADLQEEPRDQKKIYFVWMNFPHLVLSFSSLTTPSAPAPRFF